MLDPSLRQLSPGIPQPADSLSDLITWILTEAVERDDPLGMLSGLLNRLRELDIPLWHLSLGMSTIDPMLRGVSFMCWRDRSTLVETFPHDELGEPTFQQGPIFYVVSRDLMRFRWRLDRETLHDEPKELDRFRREGATDYLLRRVRFPRLGTADAGVVLAFATDRAGGFKDEHVAVFDRLMPAMALAGRTISISRIAKEALSVYLGTRTAHRVLAGEIRRGQGQTISAAIMIADLRGFTSLSEREDAVRVVGWLDEHLEVIGTAVEQYGGEVLKFLGDGLLAIFPFAGDAGSAEQVCEKALEAAELALEQTVRLNAERQDRGDPILGLGIVLHAGEVVYGNVGGSRRLDFTVIGSAVNEASRMEGLCGPLGSDLLLSEAFASLCGRPTRSLGSFELRGLEGKRTIRVLDGGSRLDEAHRRYRPAPIP